MSWLQQIAAAVFPPYKNNKQKLPLAPSIMAAGSPWYEEIIISREEVKLRLIKEVIKEHPHLQSIKLAEIVMKVMGTTPIKSYRDYYIYLHIDFLHETIETAQDKYEERHLKNMRLFYIIARLKILFGKYVQQLRRRLRDKNKLLEKYRLKGHCLEI